MKTKEVCAQLGVTSKMLRVYEREKLISAPREENNYREYSMEDVLLIQIISTLRGLGFSLKEIKGILALRTSRQDCFNHFYIQLKATEAKLYALLDVRKQLNQTINNLLSGEGDQGLERIIEKWKAQAESADVYAQMMSRWNFDRMAMDYIANYLEEDLPYIRSIDALKETLQSRTEGADVLDVGCGNGNLWNGFPANISLTLMDNSLQMLLAARESVPWARMKLEDILLVDPSRWEKYDLVVSTFMLHHIPFENQGRAITNLAAFCKPGGEVIVLDRSFRNVADREAKKERWLAGGDPRLVESIHTEFFLLADQMETRLREMGFDPEVRQTEEDIYLYRFQKIQ